MRLKGSVRYRGKIIAAAITKWLILRSTSRLEMLKRLNCQTSSMPQKLLYLVLLIFICRAVMGQDTTSWESESTQKGSTLLNERPWTGQIHPQGEIRVHEDRRIAILDSLKRRYPTKIKGYRVQIFFGNREEARRKRIEFTARYPQTPAYISYLAPNFRLRVGDFRTRIEAEKLKHDLGNRYQGCYIVKDEIELPALVPEDDPEVGE